MPVTGLGLALSWAVYGLVKKVAQVGAVEALAVETMIVAPVGLAYLAVLAAQGRGHATTGGPVHLLPLVGAGVITIVPLVLFSAGAPHVPIVTLGPIQYAGPGIQFLLGVLLEALARRGPDLGRRRDLRLFAGTGVLGGYTTYSTFAVDTDGLLQASHLDVSLLYALATVLVGAAASIAGIAVAAAMRRPRAGGA